MAKQAGGDTVYKLVEVIGTSTQSWEDAAKNAVETAARTLQDLRIDRAFNAGRFGAADVQSNDGVLEQLVCLRDSAHKRATAEPLTEMPLYMSVPRARQWVAHALCLSAVARRYLARGVSGGVL